MRKQLFYFLAGSLLLGSCASAKIETHYAPESDFSKFKTFSILGWTSMGDRIDRYYEEQFEKSAASELKKRGMTQVSMGGDIVVAFCIILTDEFSSTAYIDQYNSFGYTYTYGWYDPTVNMRNRSHESTKGTLLINIFDFKTKKPVWEGVLSKKISDDYDVRDRNIPIYIKKVFKDYPVEPLEENKN